jgi:hypothetical protein
MDLSTGGWPAEGPGRPRKRDVLAALATGLGLLIAVPPTLPSVAAGVPLVLAGLGWFAGRSLPCP